MKDIRTYLINCNVPETEIESAVESIQIAKTLSKGLLWHKIVARFFKSSKMAKIVVSNKVKRVSDFDRSYIAYDVARCKNINAFGDNAAWGPDGPIDENVYDFSVGSLEYDKAIKRNYWKRGVFPGDYKAVKAWYVRNAGEQEACDRGPIVNNPISADDVLRWKSENVTVYKLGQAWQIIARDKLFGFIPVIIRVGYEIDNLYDFDKKAQMRYPLDGEHLRAPVTWSILPIFK